MALLMRNVFLDITGIIVVILVVIYASFLWIYQTWKRKKVPYFEPTFPFGNLQPMTKQISQQDDVVSIITNAKKQGKQFEFN